MGFPMRDFAPKFMTSQLAGVFDASFSSSAVMENENLANLLQIPSSAVRILSFPNACISKGIESWKRKYLKPPK